jgi:hypothetical protein
MTAHVHLKSLLRQKFDKTALNGSLTLPGALKYPRPSQYTHADPFEPIRVLLLPLAPAGRPAFCCSNPAL